MPKVSFVHLTIQGKTTEFSIYYTKKERFHLKDFPMNIIHTVNSVYAKDVNEVASNFETEAELIEYYTKQLNNFHTIISSTKKVIAYYLSAPESFKKLPGISKEISNRFGFAGKEDNVFGFTIQYQVLFQQTDDGTKYLRVKEDGTAGGREHVPAHMATVLDWTEEREAFFKMIAENMETLFLKVVSIMGDGETLSLMIDKGDLKLLS